MSSPLLPPSGGAPSAGSPAELHIPEMRPDAPASRGGLSRYAIMAVAGGFVAVAVALVAYDFSNDSAQADPSPPNMTGFGSKLSADYKPEDPPPADPEPAARKPPAARVARPEPQRSRQVLLFGDAISDPNKAIAQRRAQAWAEGEGYVDLAQLEAEAGAGHCLVRDGEVFQAQQRGGVLQLLRPLYGVDQRNGQACRAAPAGSTVALGAIEEEDGPVCVVRLDTVGAARASYDVDCWEVFNITGGNGRSNDGALYDIRTIGDLTTMQG